jgi:predicted nucleic acid-binding OB-fold protein
MPLKKRSKLFQRLFSDFKDINLILHLMEVLAIGKKTV